MRHHLNPTLQLQYLTVTSPYALWLSLWNRFNHQQTMFLPKTRYNWIHFRVHDYPTIAKYNIEMYKVTSRLSLCGEPIDDAHMIEKTLSTFHAANNINTYDTRNIQILCQCYCLPRSMISCCWRTMENNLLEHFPCRVMQHTYQQCDSHFKDQGEDWSQRKGAEYRRRGKLKERVNDPPHNLHRRFVFQSHHPQDHFFEILVRVLSVESRVILPKIVRLTLTL
jgi:hypothetical protein